MRVEVRLFATFARYLPKDHPTDSAFVDVAEGSTVGEVAGTLGIPDGASRIILVNDCDADEAHVLHPGDVVTLFPPLAGGARPMVIHCSRLDRTPSEASRNPVGLPDFKSGVRL